MPHGEDARRARILIADDNVEFRQSTAEILELSHYDVVEATSRADAAARLNEECFDLLLLDLGIDRGGLEVLEGRTRLPVVLAISGMEDDPADERIAAFLTKPLSPVRLLAEVARSLGTAE